MYVSELSLVHFTQILEITKPMRTARKNASLAISGEAFFYADVAFQSAIFLPLSEKQRGKRFFPAVFQPCPPADNSFQFL